MRERIEQERLNLAMDLLESGTARDLPQVRFVQGYAAGLKSAISYLEEIESEG